MRHPFWRPPFTLNFVWAILPFALVAIGFGVMPLKSWDYWWHIAFGRMTAATHEIPMHAHWLYTMPADAPAWVQPWLAQWLMYHIHEAFGLHGALLLRNVLAATAFGGLGLWAARRAGSPMVGALLALLASAFGFFTIAARTHLFVWPLFLVLLPTAYALRSGRGHLSALCLFPVVTALWVNLHGSFPIPIFLAGTFAAAELFDRWRGGASHTPRGPTWWHWGVTAAACFVATGLNPRGWAVWDYLLRLSLSEDVRAVITEWWPTWPWSPVGYGALFYLLVLAVAGLMWRARARLDAADAVVLLWVAALTVMQARFLLWFAFTLPIVASPYLQPRGVAEESMPSNAMQAVNVMIGVALIVVGLAVQPWSNANPLAAELQAAPARTSEPDLGLAQADAPYDAIPALKQRFAEVPRLFHDHKNAGFLLYQLDVGRFQQVVFLDNRVELWPAADWEKFDAIGRGENAEAELDAWEVEAVVASYDTQAGLIEVLQGSPRWSCPVDRDGYVVCWRAGSATVDEE